jgi:hypothetical protein
MSVCTFVQYTKSAPLPVDLVRLYAAVQQDVADANWELRKSKLTDMAGDWQDQAQCGLIQEP